MKKEIYPATKVGQMARAFYLSRMGSDYSFTVNPYLSEAVFRECFAMAAHQHKVFYHRGKGSLSQEELDDRRHYIRFFRHARRMIIRAITTLKKNEDGGYAPIIPQPTTAPVQLRLDLGPTPDVKARLQRLRDELATLSTKRQ